MASFSPKALSCAPDQPEAGSARVPPFPVIYREHFDFVWRTLGALGVDRATLDDAVQDVFIVVHRRSQDFEGRASLKTWVFGIAYRVAANYRRTRQRRGPVEELPPELASDAGTPHDAAQANEAARFMRGFLDGLNEGKRAVFAGCVLEQMTAPEVAEVLGCPLGTVYTRLRTVRSEFREALAERARGGQRA